MPGSFDPERTDHGSRRVIGELDKLRVELRSDRETLKKEMELHVEVHVDSKLKGYLHGGAVFGGVIGLLSLVVTVVIVLNGPTKDSFSSLKTQVEQTEVKREKRDEEFKSDLLRRVEKTEARTEGVWKVVGEQKPREEVKREVTKKTNAAEARSP